MKLRRRTLFYCGTKLFKEEQKEVVKIRGICAYVHASCLENGVLFAKEDYLESLKKENLGASFSKMESRKKSKFSALEEYFQKQDARRIVLSFSEIEEILGYPLCSFAYLYKSYWYKKESGSIRRTCFQCGYVIKKVELKKKKLVFEQDCKRRLSLPTNAKLEMIALQKYIWKKCGITKGWKGGGYMVI